MRDDIPENTCPVCYSILTQPRASAGGDLVHYSCPFCGNFGLTRTADTLVPKHIGKDTETIAVFSHYLRKIQQSERWPVVDWETAKKIINEGVLPTPREQADNLVRWIGDNAKDPGQYIPVQSAQHQSVVGAISAAGLAFVMQGLIDQGILAGKVGLGGAANVLLTFKGWDRYEDLRRGAPSGRVAFMAMQFGDPVLDRVMNTHFRPAVDQTGFVLRRLDDAPKAGLIDDRLRVEIQGARFLVVDLTHGNKGAYWEAGYAEGLGKPVIYTCEESKFREASHFDTNHHLTVMWTEATLDHAMQMLKATIRATIPEAKRQDA